MRYPRLVAFALTAALTAACSAAERTSEAAEPVATNGGAAAPSTDRKYLLERVDDAAVVQLYADGFASLPLREKALIWHLSQASIAGRDIFIDQKHRNALEMRAVLEAILSHPQGVDSATRAEIERYTKLFWINNGPYHNLTAQKFVLKTTPQAFAAAAKSAGQAGARFPVAKGESLDALLTRLEPMFFDPKVDPVVTNKNPRPGEDILTSSANNLYSNVGTADLKGFSEKYPLNSRLVKQNGRLVEEVYRFNGRYDSQIREIVKHLALATQYASPAMSRALRALIQFYRSGEEADRVKYDIAWVQDKESPVDTINGFIEVYLDARGIKGSWESIVFYVNQEKTGRIRTLANNAQWFEDHMPWDAKYRKPDVKGIVANAIDVVIETGDAGPISAVGINLPNDSKVREEHGSKSVSLSNIREAGDNANPGTTRNEFSWTPEEVERGAEHGTFAAEMHTSMHEVIGHASGRQSPTLAGSPQEALKEHASALEEARADLVALYFIADPKLVELGVLPAADHDVIARTQYESYTRVAITQLLRVGRAATQLEQDHMRNRQMVVHWLMANTKAIERRMRDGKTYYVMVDPQAFREGVGRLLAEVQRIKGEGDYPAAKKLFDTYGVRFDPKLRDEVIARVEKLNPPAYTGFVMPKLTPVTEAGEITDVKISYPMDLTTQMLEWSGARRN
jgi:dipeptidyl-peptidase III